MVVLGDRDRTVTLLGPVLERAARARGCDARGCPHRPLCGGDTGRLRRGRPVAPVEVGAVVGWCVAGHVVPRRGGVPGARRRRDDPWHPINADRPGAPYPAAPRASRLTPSPPLPSRGWQHAPRVFWDARATAVPVRAGRGRDRGAATRRRGPWAPRGTT